MDEFGRREFGLAIAHRVAILGGLLVGILSFAFSLFVVVGDVALHYVTGGGLRGPGMEAMEGVFPMFVSALAFGLTALASRPARPVDPAETRELRRAMVLLGELENKLGNR